MPTSTSTTNEPTIIGSGPLPIAILDDYPLLSPNYLSSLSESDLAKVTITIYRDTISPDLSTLPHLISRLSPYHVIITMRERTPFPGTLISSLPNLKYLLTTGLRNLSLDLASFSSRGIIVTGTPAPPVPKGGISATAQHTLALILSLASNIPRDNDQTRSGEWLTAQPLNSLLAGKTLGLYGLGKLGGEVARLGHVFGLRIIAWSENLTQEKADVLSAQHGLEKGTFRVVDSKQALLEQADILSIHVVLGDRTRGAIGKDELAQLKKTAMLVNTSRGPIVDEEALLDVLEKGRIRGAAVDVYAVEPLPLDSRWRTTEWGTKGKSQVIITPHSGYAYEETLDAMWTETIHNLRRYLANEDVQHRLA